MLREFPLQGVTDEGEFALNILALSIWQAVGEFVQLTRESETLIVMGRAPLSFTVRVSYNGSNSSTEYVFTVKSNANRIREHPIFTQARGQIRMWFVIEYIKSLVGDLRQ
jgi:hypothetical protein